jgi:hypothetical protein
MDPKEIRKKILEVLYLHRQDDFFETRKFVEELKSDGFDVGDRTLHGEIKYLKDKGYLETMSEFCGSEYLYFAALRITSCGVDLVEDPEQFGKLFSIKIHTNSFGDISNSNISIDSSNIQQIINSETDPDLKLKLGELQDALKEKDKGKIIKILSYIGDKSIDVLIALLINKISNT